MPPNIWLNLAGVANVWAGLGNSGTGGSALFSLGAVALTVGGGKDLSEATGVFALSEL
jgi:hypothetical protein